MTFEARSPVRLAPRARKTSVAEEAVCSLSKRAFSRERVPVSDSWGQARGLGQNLHFLPRHRNAASRARPAE
jgi:hypothetical protein